MRSFVIGFYQIFILFVLSAVYTWLGQYFAKIAYAAPEPRPVSSAFGKVSGGPTILEFVSGAPAVIYTCCGIVSGVFILVLVVRKILFNRTQGYL